MSELAILFQQFNDKLMTYILKYKSSGIKDIVFGNLALKIGQIRFCEGFKRGVKRSTPFYLNL